MFLSCSVQGGQKCRLFVFGGLQGRREPDPLRRENAEEATYMARNFFNGIVRRSAIACSPSRRFPVCPPPNAATQADPSPQQMANCNLVRALAFGARRRDCIAFTRQNAPEARRADLRRWWANLALYSRQHFRNRRTRFNEAGRRRSNEVRGIACAV